MVGSRSLYRSSSLYWATYSSRASCRETKVQSATPEELERLPEGDRHKESISVWTLFALRDGNTDEGDKEAALKWLNEPNRALSWKVPADLIASETGAYEVIKLITRLEHGVYS